MSNFNLYFSMQTAVNQERISCSLEEINMANCNKRNQNILYLGGQDSLQQLSRHSTTQLLLGSKKNAA